MTTQELFKLYHEQIFQWNCLIGFIAVLGIISSIAIYRERKKGLWRLVTTIFFLLFAAYFNINGQLIKEKETFDKISNVTQEQSRDQLEKRSISP